MKNLLKNRKGFTLAEMLLVVAIIVILSGVTIIGVASWVNQSQQTAAKLVNDGVGFEAEAYESVKKKKGYVEYEPSESETLDPGTGEEELWNGHDAAWWAANDAEMEQKIKDLEAAGVPKDKISVTRDEKGHITEVKDTSEGGSGSGGEGTTTTTTSGGSNASGSTIAPHPNVGNDAYWTSQLQFNSPMNSCIVVVPNGSSVVLNQWQYEMEKIDDHTYKIYYKGDGNGRTKQNNITIRLPDGGYIQSYD